MTRLGILTASICLSLAGPVFGQQPVFVDNDPTITFRDGLSWATAFEHVQEGIDAAEGQVPPGNEVLVAEGTYSPTIQWSGSGDPRAYTFLMKDGVNLRGGYLGGPNGSVNPKTPDGSYEETILSGAGPGGGMYHVVVSQVNFVTSECIIDGFAITGGNANDSSFPHDRGGGLFVFTAPTHVENVTFRQNKAVLGGGAYSIGNTGKELHIRWSSFRGNWATKGAGFYVDPSQDLEICNVRFRNNGNLDTTLVGGGMYVAEGVILKASNCLFDGNAAKDAGGGIYVKLTPDLPSTDNHEWRHCTVALNEIQHPSSNGAGMHYGGGVGSPATLTNSILYDNANNGGVDLYVQSPGTLTYSYCNIGISTGGTAGLGNMSQDPLFVNPADRNFRLRGPTMLLPWSPCLDAGRNSQTGSDFLDVDDNGVDDVNLLVDLDLRFRWIDIPSVGSTETADMGAYETPGSN